MSNLSDLAIERALSDFVSGFKKERYNPEFFRIEEDYNPSLQIDWITAKVPFYADGKLNGGNIINTTPEGEIEYTIDKRLPVVGSHESKLSIRTCDVIQEQGKTCLIELSGNPVKWFQGHNLFGTDDLPNLLYEAVLRLSDILNCPQPKRYLEAIKMGSFRLSRVDITGMFKLPTRSDVYAWLNHAEKTCRTRAGTALSKGTTVYLNKASEYWNVVMYSKGQELEKHNLPCGLSGGHLEDFADNKLRVELRLKGKELKRIGLGTGHPWLNIDPWHIYKDYVSRVEMSEQAIRNDKLFEVPKTARMTYELWSRGADIRQFVGKTKFYKDRKILLEFGVDISIPKPSQNSIDCSPNVVPLKRVLELKPVGAPKWAQGTNLLFEPRKICG